jgi:dTDP-4-dehydrorhamnose 3,5-epimerase
MAMQFREISLPGCYEIVPQIFQDNRGLFVKTFHEELFSAQGLITTFAEEFYSLSHKGVLRGFHFQVPPKDLVKLVYCVMGATFDVLVDLRVGSPTFGRHAVCELSAEKANMIYIPSGLAHGFYAKTSQVLMMYKVSAVYSSEHDSGILWNSLNIPWPDHAPLISERDKSFLPFAKFVSPFRYAEERSNERQK